MPTAKSKPKRPPHEWKAPPPEEANKKAQRPYKKGFRWEPNIPFIEELASHGMTQEQIARACDISPQTFSDRKEEFLGAIKRGADRGIAQVSNKLFEGAMKGNTIAQVFYLKARAGWRDQQLNTEGQGVPLAIVVPGTVSGIEWEKLYKEFRERQKAEESAEPKSR